MPRQNKREVSREIKSIARKAKGAMYKWVMLLNREPSEEEIVAWQAGYISGLNSSDHLHK